MRSKSVGADLSHWKAYASKNKSPDKGGTGERPPMKLATPVTKKATGGPVKKRADRVFARGGRTAGAETGVGRMESAKRSGRHR